MDKDFMTVEKVLGAQEKAHIVEEVLLDLPEWFGLPESTREYIEQAKDLPLWVARNHRGIEGFITLNETSASTCEIHCMGVKKASHGRGIGKTLLKSLETFAKEKYAFIQVKTVDEGHYKEYDKTIKFYEAMGFRKLEVFPTLWDEWNPCLILVKSLH